MKPIVKIAIVGGVQVLLLLSLIGFKQYTIWTGETVLLKVQPVDPRDLLRGDYVTVQYEISNLDTDRLAGDDDVYERIYVELQEEDDGYWSAVAVHDRRQRTFDNTVLIDGEVWSAGFDDGSRNVRYGIEDIFIPEGSGSQLPFGDDHVVAVGVSIDRWGNAIPREFFVDGEPFPLKRR